LLISWEVNLANDWGRSHESLLHFRKSNKIIFNVDEVRVPYNAHTLRYPHHPQAKSSQCGNGKEYVWTPHPKGAKPKDVFEIPTLTNNSWEREKHSIIDRNFLYSVSKTLLSKMNKLLLIGRAYFDVPATTEDKML